MLKGNFNRWLLFLIDLISRANFGTSVSLIVFLTNFFCDLCSGEFANVNLKPRQNINEGTKPRFESPIRNDRFKLLGISDGSVYIGARQFLSNNIANGQRIKDALYTLSVLSLQVNNVISWSAPGQTVEECSMKGKNESECRNYIRMHVRLKNGQTLVCGTHAFAPTCRLYEFSKEEEKFIDRLQIDGIALSPFDPASNFISTFVKESNYIFTGTVSDFNGNDPLIYRKHLPKGDILRTQKDDRVINAPHFVGSFSYKGYVYFWYNEQAVDAQDNNKEAQIYPRVGRVCASDKGGGQAPMQDRWSTFLKSRLNCSIPETPPFYFNILQSISDPVSDGGDDAIVYAVFHTPISLLISAVCSFRISQIDANFDHGRFKVRRTPTSHWSSYQQQQQSYFAAASGNETERPGSCNTRRSSADISLIVKNPLMYHLVQPIGHQPILIEGPMKAQITSIAVASPVRSVRNQRHDIIYVGRSDGSIGKYVETRANRTTIYIEAVSIFDGDPILEMTISPVSTRANEEQKLIVTSNSVVTQVPFQHCLKAHSCSRCVGMRDPHCAWELELQRCVHSREWTRGSYVQNILTGQSEQCPGFISADGSYKVEEDTPDGTGTGWMDSNVSASGDSPLDKLSFLYTPGGLSLVILAIVFALVIGFLIGWRIQKMRLLGQLSRTAGSDRSYGSDYGEREMMNEESEFRFPGTTKLSRPSSLKDFNTRVYTPGQYVHGANGDTMSLVYGNNYIGNSHFMPMKSTSNGPSRTVSGANTPRMGIQSSIMYGGGDPHEYMRVKKVYL